MGCPVAEVPDYLLRDSYGSGVARSQGRGSRHGGQTLNKRVPQSTPVMESEGASGAKRSRSETGIDASGNNDERPTKLVCREDESQASELAEDEPASTSAAHVAGSSQIRDADELENQVPPNKRHKKQGMRLCHFFLRGRCKKGTKCEFLHERSSKPLNGERREEKSQQAAASMKRKPSLLAKLLDTDIQREKSQILQCLRFFVNNCFLLEYPSQPLEFFSWLQSEGEAEGEPEGEPECEPEGEPECEPEGGPECEPSDNGLAAVVKEPEQ